MIKLVLNKISRIILNKQDKLKKNFFLSINKNQNKLCVFDIGGAGGLQTRWQTFENYIRPIFVEPDKRSFIDLKKNRKEVIDKALWSNTSKKEFYLTKKKETSSMFLPNRAFLDLFPESDRYDIEKTVKIDVTELDKIIDYKYQPHFMKLDIQGAELEVLRGSKKTLTNVLGLEIEVNFKEIYHDIPLSHDVEEFLKKEGFVLYDFVTLSRWERCVHRNFGEIIHGDALYLRNPEYVINTSKKLSDPIILFENYVKILFVYNRVDLIKRLSKSMSKKHYELLNLKLIIKILEKKLKKIRFYNNFYAYFTRYLISKDIEFPYWKL